MACKREVKMKISDSDMEKLENLKKKLTITYKMSTKVALKQELKAQIEEIDRIFADINAGKFVDLAKFNIFSKSTRDSLDSEKDRRKEVLGVYEAIRPLKLCKSSKDSEADLLFSYFHYFENQFYPCLTPQNFKLRFDAGKKRDNFLLIADILKKDFKNYQDDINNAAYVKGEEQGAIYEEKLKHEKHVLISKVTDFFEKILNFIEVIDKAMEDGDTILLEPEREVSYQVVDERDKADFNRMEVKNILPELSLFLKSFFDNVQLPNFAKNALKR